MPKSQVSVFTRHDYLHLRWTYKGIQYRLSTQLPDTKENRKAVQAKVKLIESDIAYEKFDTTLEKYGKVVRKIEEFKEISFYEVWLKFYEYKSHMISKGTTGKYRAVTGKIKLFYDEYPSVIDSRFVQSTYWHVNPSVSNKTLKERFGYYCACWNWGQNEGLILPELKNPFEGLTKMIKVEPKQPPKPFTRNEVGTIIGWFGDNSHYEYYVRFLFYTGCRVSEAIGLRLSHIDWEQKTIWIGESLTRGVRKSTKTNKARIIPMNDSIMRTIREAIYYSNRSAEDMEPDSLIFVSPAGKPISDHNFNQRIWRKCLGECEIPYRRPYNCRHTFISHCLEKGMSPATVASITGHDVQTLYENYAGSVLSKPELPELF